MLKSLYRRLASSASRAAFAAPALLRRFLPHDIGRDYRTVWVGMIGAGYRRDVYERQRAGGGKPLLDNPTVDEIRAALHADQARTVLEVGCGWGRLAAQLQDSFQVSGCDVSDDMLRLCPPGLAVFRHDIAVEDQDWLRANTARWDALFTRGVMLYFNDPAQLAQVMNAMLVVCRGRIHIWEWPEVCDNMCAVNASERFVYHRIEHKAE